MMISSAVSKNKSVNICCKKNKKLTQIEKSISNKYSKESNTFEVNELRSQLMKAETSEDHIHEGVSFIQERNKSVDSLRNMSEKLKQLSDKYNSDKYTDEDKENIKKQAKDLIDNMDNIINEGFEIKNKTSSSEISIETCHGSNIIIDTKPLKISMDDTMIKYNPDNKRTSIEGSLSIDNILKNTNKIEKNLIKPLDEYSDNMRKQMSSIAGDAMYQDMIVNMAVKQLCDLGDMDGDTARRIIRNSKIILEECGLGDIDQDTAKQTIANFKNVLEDSNNALRCQSSALSRDAALQLLN
ncbi:hypothetical protein [Clostridium ljungdahlii]|uniref:hypothetical protein n=1 Tax=Clostridium ljungdahlii TaxID=1538 RepID=UPI003863C637